MVPACLLALAPSQQMPRPHGHQNTPTSGCRTTTHHVADQRTRKHPHRGYESFEDFLGELKQRKRKSIRQERKGVAAQGLAIKWLLGSEVTAAMWDKVGGR
jgi:predicted N-acyltransferase